ncbi:hypothetical protein IU450_12865 [Nocardia abscessus]|uniref:hypothetical protein n=1 Tax=Nocardia abscessus TaxID=120957 RepID=UPI0018946653|nr:hypothetical protein [Nocardia abscessus]MBF6336776.1 hypothetical protein [Nocardia abscessus]
MAVIQARAWRRWIAPAGVSVSLIIAAATASADPIVPAGPPPSCGETPSGPASAACGADKPGSRGPAAPPPALPLQMLAPPPARSAPSANTPAGALVPPTPGPGSGTPIVPAR